MGELFLSVSGEVGGFEKLCVVKKVLGNLTDRTVHGRFLDEAKVVVRLNHSNLVQVFDAGCVEDEYYLTMELVEGKDLRAIWNRCAQLKRRIPVQFAISVIRDVCRGLDYVHNAGGLEMVHRDISPPNIMVSYHGQVKITDFGLAKHTIKSEFTMPGVVYGRYSYLAPEQARGQAADRRSDIYAAGIVLWEMLTGRQMFPVGNNGRQVTELRALCNPEFVPPSRLVPGIPEGLDQVLARALAAERDDRFSHAEEFRVALKEILARHFPAHDLDGVSEFMREIFEQERAFELEDYANYAKEDFSSVRNSSVTQEKSEPASAPDQSAGPSDQTPVQPLPTQLSGAIPLKPQLLSEPPAEDSAKSDKAPAGPPEPPPTAAQRERETVAKACEARVGRIVNNRYRLERLIGHGAMGAVYVATHLGLEKEYAIKILHELCESGSEGERRFLSEARAATRPSHPNIVDVCNIGTTESGEPFLVMELLEGVDLAQIIAEQGPMHVSRMATIVGQVCSALAAAHRAGIVHRDLKSENIMVINQDQEADFVKVLDFGVCKFIDNSNSKTTSPGMVLGSPDYMSPEQAIGGEIDGKSDIYSLGTVMFEMLTGRLPFTGQNSVEILTKKRCEDAPRVSTLRSDIPPEVAALVDRCLEREPARRPPTMRMVSYDLIKAIHGRPTAVAAHLGLQDPQAGIDAGFHSAEFAQEPDIPAAPPPLTTEASGQHFLPSSSNSFTSPSGRLLTHDTLEEPSTQVHSWWDLRLPKNKALAVLCASGCFALGVAISHWSRPAQRIPLPNAESSALDTNAASSGGPQAEGGPFAGSPEGKEAPKTVKEVQAQQAAQDVAKENNAQAPERSPKAKRVAYWLQKSRDALEAQRWTSPPNDNLALALTRLGLVDPTRPELGQYRGAANKVLLANAASAYAQHNWRLAARNYRDSSMVAPGSSGVAIRLAKSLGRWAREALKSGDTSAADRASAELLNLRPDSVEAHRLRATVLEAMQDMEGAAAEYRAIVRLDENDRRAAKALSRIRRQKKKSASQK